jgi:hypothetical protein
MVRIMKFTKINVGALPMCTSEVTMKIQQCYDLTYQTHLTKDLKHNQPFQNPTDQAMGCTNGGLDPSRSKRFFSSQKCPDWFWVPLTLLLNGYRGLFPQE